MLQMLSCMIHEHLQMLQILLHMLHKVPLVLYTRQKNNDYIEKQKSGKTPTQKHVGHVRQQALLHFRILKHPTRRLFNI